MKIKPTFGSTIETNSFWAPSISQCLRNAADWLEQEGLETDENVDNAIIHYNEEEEQFLVTIPGRCKVGKHLISGKKPRQGARATFTK